jgi:hypothetical protein
LGQPLSPDGPIPIASGRFPEHPLTINRISANFKPGSKNLYIYTNPFSPEDAQDSMPYRSPEVPNDFKFLPREIPQGRFTGAKRLFNCYLTTLFF